MELKIWQLIPDYPTTWGAMPFKNQIINEKAVVIEKLEKAGAVMLCKLSSGSLAGGMFGLVEKLKTMGYLKVQVDPLLDLLLRLQRSCCVRYWNRNFGSIISPSTRCGVTGLRPTLVLFPPMGS